MNHRDSLKSRYHFKTLIYLHSIIICDVQISTVYVQVSNLWQNV
jgi:hypothetical protein